MPRRRSQKVATEKELKYRAVYENIAAGIESGKWLPGDRLPTEATLATTTKVSLGTVQKALRILEQEGIVVRRHGSGTYVASASPSPNEIFNFFFLGDDGSALPLYTKVLELGRTSKNGPWSNFLEQDRGFIKVSRVTNVNLEFQAYMELYARESQFGRLCEMPIRKLDGPELYRTMFNSFHYPPSSFTYHVWLATAPARVYKHIGVEPGRECLHWEILGFGHRDMPLFYQQVYLPPTTRKLRFDALPKVRLDKSQYSASSARRRELVPVERRHAARHADPRRSARKKEYEMAQHRAEKPSS